MEVGSGKHFIPVPTHEEVKKYKAWYNSLEDGSIKKMNENARNKKMKYERKKSYEKRRPRKFNVFVFV